MSVFHLLYANPKHSRFTKLWRIRTYSVHTMIYLCQITSTRSSSWSMKLASHAYSPTIGSLSVTRSMPVLASMSFYLDILQMQRSGIKPCFRAFSWLSQCASLGVSYRFAMRHSLLLTYLTTQIRPCLSLPNLSCLSSRSTPSSIAAGLSKICYQIPSCSSVFSPILKWWKIVRPWKL